MEKDTELVRKLVKGILQRTGVMQVATRAGRSPRVATVWFSYDGDMNLYFMSRKDREHSKDIARNKEIAGSIVDPGHAKPGNAVRGLSFQGTAREVKGRELKTAYELYRMRYQTISDRVSFRDITEGSTPFRLFKIIPRGYTIFDEVDFEEQPRRELRIRN